MARSCQWRLAGAHERLAPGDEGNIEYKPWTSTTCLAAWSRNYDTGSRKDGEALYELGVGDDKPRLG